MTNKTLINGLSWTLVGEFVNKATLFFATMYFAKILNAEGYGLFSLIQSIVMYTVMLIEISPTMYGIREVAKQDELATVTIKAQAIFSLRVFSGLLISAVYLLTVLLIDINNTTRQTALYFCFYILSYSLYTDWLHKGRENFKGIAIASLTQALFFIPGVLILIQKPDDVAFAALVWSLSFTIHAIMLIIQQKNEIGVFIPIGINVKQWKYNILESYHFTLNGLLGMAYQYIPLFALSVFSTLSAVASFSLVYKMAFAICGLAFYLPSVFYPRLSALYNKENKRFIRLQKKLLLIMLTGAGLFLVMAYFGKGYIIDYFTDEKYPEIGSLYNLLSLLIVAYLIRFSFNVPLLAMEKQSIITKQMFVASLFVLCVSVPLVLYYGAIGAAVSVLSGELIIILIAALSYYKNIPKEISRV